MTLESLQPGCLYHIYNHAVGNDDLFLSADNYNYFLKRYHYFIDPVADTYVYCLMPNHVHFVVEIKRQIQLPKGRQYDAASYVSKQFSNLFSSYAQAFNKQQKRKGNLFTSRFRRERINSDEYLTNLIRYIHLNPVHHGFISDFTNWNYSSYSRIISHTDDYPGKEKVISWFGNVDGFKKAHLDRMPVARPPSTPEAPTTF